MVIICPWFWWLNTNNRWDKPLVIANCKSFSYDLVLSFYISNDVNLLRGLKSSLRLKQYLKVCNSTAFMTPMNLLEEVTNFLSLALRILEYLCRWSNDKLASLTFTSGYFWYQIAFRANLVWTAFSMFISCVQAYVFTLLSSNNLRNKINDEE